MHISLIIPAFEESKKIANDIRAAAEFIEANKFQGEIIVVDDGSKDDTAGVANDVQIPSHISKKIIRYELNRGKGFAVKTGVCASVGDYVVFTDSGLCTPYRHILQGINIIKNDEADIAHGSRKLKTSKIVKPHPWNRKIISKLFRWIFILLLRVPYQLTDTQCGFKIYKGNVARKLYADCITEGFLFDIEIILRARKQGFRIKEFPIEWTADLDSRLTSAKNVRRVLNELIALKGIVTRL